MVQGFFRAPSSPIRGFPKQGHTIISPIMTLGLALLAQDLCDPQ
jgi:hypothetical protein